MAADRRRSDLSRSDFRRGLFGVGVVGGLVAVAVSMLLFPRLSSNSDEGVYLSQAEAMREGLLFPSLPARSTDAFHPWFASVDDQRVVYRYQPGFAAVLAVSLVATGSSTPALALVGASAGIGVAALARLLGARRRAALLAGLLFIVAPGVAVQTGTYLPYLFTLSCALASACLILLSSTWPGWRRSSCLVLAGLLWGVVAFCRPYDGLLFAVPLGYLVVTSDPERGRWIRSGLLVVAGSVPLVVLGLLYNRAATGDAFRLAFTMFEPKDTIGFGPRRVLPQDPLVDYTPAKAARSLVTWGVLVVNTLPGGVLFGACAVFGLVRDARASARRRAWIFQAGLLVTWTVGYGFFWGIYAVTKAWTGAIFLGPYYFLPVVAILCIAGAAVVEQLDLGQPWVVAAVVLGVVATAGSYVGFGYQNLPRTEHRVTVADRVEQSIGDDPDALLLIPPYRGKYLQHPFSWLRNGPVGDDAMRYALALNPELFDLAARSPERNLYLLSVPGDLGDWTGDVSGTSVDRQAVLEGEEVAVEVEALEETESSSELVVAAAGQVCTSSVEVSPSEPIRLRADRSGRSLVVGSGASACTIDLRGRTGSVIVTHQRGVARTTRVLPWRWNDERRFELLVPGELVDYDRSLGLIVAPAP